MTLIKTQQQAEDLLKHAHAYPFHSMQYKAAEELLGCTLLSEGDGALLAYGTAHGRTQLHWAADDAPKLIAAIEKVKNQLPAVPLALEFVPEGFVAPLESADFTIEAEFVDFFIDDLSSVVLDQTHTQNMSFLPPDESAIAQAHAVDHAVAWSTRGFFGDEPSFFREWMQDEYGNILTHRDQDGTLLGICFVTLYNFESPKGPVLWLREIAVLPQAQGKGIGRTLVSQALAYGKQQGATRAFLACDVQNHHAIRLYNHFGFVQMPGRGQINMVCTHQ